MQNLMFERLSASHRSFQSIVPRYLTFFSCSMFQDRVELRDSQIMDIEDLHKLGRPFLRKLSNSLLYVILYCSALFIFSLI
jgi:hypothetical protein